MPLAWKYKFLLRLVARPAAAARSDYFIDAAGWVALGQVLLERTRRRTAPEGGAEDEGADLSFCRQALEQVARTVSAPSLPPPCVLAAIAHLFPVLLTFAYTLPGMCEFGAKTQMPQLSQVFAASPYASAGVLCRMGSPSRSVPHTITPLPAFAEGPPSSAGGPVDAHDPSLPCTAASPVVLLAPCPFCDASPLQAAAQSRLTAEVMIEGPESVTCRSCGQEALQLDWEIFHCGTKGDQSYTGKGI